MDGAQFYFGVDASGGSRSKDPRTRLCRWGISAVALNATGEWHRVAWKSGLLPGRKQTVARAELYALVQLLRHTSGPISFSSDSQLNMKLFKRLVSTRRLRPSWSNLDLWHEVREALLQRWLRGTWVRSHLTLPLFKAEFGPDLDWAYFSNAYADEAAVVFSRWLDRQPLLSTWVDIRKWSDTRNWKILEYLTSRAVHILRAPREARKQGPKPATRREFLVSLPILYPHHSWKIGHASSFSGCRTCGLRVKDQREGEELAAGPCYRTTLDWVGRGVHPSHELDFIDQRHGWRCRFCRRCLKPHSREAAWFRLSRVCHRA